MERKKLDEMLKHEEWQKANLDHFLTIPFPPSNYWKLFIDFLVSKETEGTKKLQVLHRMKTKIHQNPKQFDKYPEVERFIDLEINDVVYSINLENGIIAVPSTFGTNNSTPQNEVASIDTSPIIEHPQLKWKGKVNQLGTMFYNLHKGQYIDNGKSELERWIIANFVDKNGKPFKLSTITTLLNESKPEKRAKVGTEFEPDYLFSDQSD